MYAYGAVTSHNGITEDNPYQYVGSAGYYTHWQDPEFKLLLLGVRFLDTETGRFTQRDPIKDGLNWYAYVSGNPLDSVDPKGLIDLGNFSPEAVFNEYVLQPFVQAYEQLQFQINNWWSDTLSAVGNWWQNNKSWIGNFAACSALCLNFSVSMAAIGGQIGSLFGPEGIIPGMIIGGGVTQASCVYVCMKEGMESAVRKFSGGEVSEHEWGKCRPNPKQYGPREIIPIPYSAPPSNYLY